jgi:hypothetical protein
MRTSTLVAVVARVPAALGLVAPLVLFGVLYVTAVQPRQAAARDAQVQLETLREQLARASGIVRSAPGVIQSSSKQEFEIRTPDEDRSAEVTEAITSLAGGPYVGGVANLAIETAPAADGPVDQRIDLFGQPVVHAPVTVTFDARFEQIGRFLWNLRSLPSTFELRSLELAPLAAGAPVMRAKVVLFMFQRITPADVRPGTIDVADPQMVDVTTPPDWRRDPFNVAPAVLKVAVVSPPPPPDPVVQSILFSGSRRVALIDGRIVREGDRLGTAVVRAVEVDTVVILVPDGTEHRLRLGRPEIGLGRR